MQLVAAESASRVGRVGREASTLKLGTQRHRGFYLAAVCGIAAGLLTFGLARAQAVVVGVNFFYLTYLIFALRQLRRADVSFLQKHADEEDAPPALIFLVMVASILVSSVLLFRVLADDDRTTVLAVGLGASAIVLGWLAIHTMWSVHYAFKYYESDDGGPESTSGPKPKKVAGGLDFPGTEEPDGVTFVYFAFTIGMTAQTSDTDVTTSAMRRIVTVQSIFSYFFNTVLVATAVNIAVSLGHVGG